MAEAGKRQTMDTANPACAQSGQQKSKHPVCHGCILPYHYLRHHVLHFLTLRSRNVDSSPSPKNTPFFSPKITQVNRRATQVNCRAPWMSFRIAKANPRRVHLFVFASSAVAPRPCSFAMPGINKRNRRRPRIRNCRIWTSRVLR